MAIQDVVKDVVLPYLPAKTLVRFKSVSKEWDRWIQSPFLAHQQSYYFKRLSGFFCQSDLGDHTFLSLDDDAYGVPSPSLEFLPCFVSIISSCNGLLLCHGFDGNNSYYICNPANKQWKELPPHGLYHGLEPAIVLGFEPSPLNMGANYDLICAAPMLDQPFALFELYSSETRQWRTSPTMCLELGDSTFFRTGFYMKGIAYWETSTREVLAFDLKNEVYEIRSLPSETTYLDGVLTQIQGELGYISVSNLLDNEYCINIYTGMNFILQQTVNMSLESELDGFLRYRVLPCVDDNKVMILAGGFVYLYNIGDERFKLIRRVDVNCCSANKYVAYVNSLVHVD